MLLSKQKSDLTQYLKFEIVSGCAKISLLLKLLTNIYTYTTTKTINQNAWNHLGYAVSINNDNYQIIFYLNGQSDSPHIFTAGHYEDLVSSYFFTIGSYYSAANTLSGYFNGFLYQLKI